MGRHLVLPNDRVGSPEPTRSCKKIAGTPVVDYLCPTEPGRARHKT
jgi:hypothetical protein